MAPLMKSLILICSLLCYAANFIPAVGGTDRQLEEIVAPTNFLGSWRVDSEVGVSAMHLQLMPNNKAVWFDSTTNGLSELKHDPPFCINRTRGRPTDPPLDCTVHAVEYDVETAQIRKLKFRYSTWCSSGSLTKNGELVSTGGDRNGFRAVRLLNPCPNCEFEETQFGLLANRWYSTNHALENGSFVVVGGRNAFNYEIVSVDAGSVKFAPAVIDVPLLKETTDDTGRENNLYPFVNLLPDGNLFVFANYKSVILNPYSGQVVRKLTDFTYSRSYPPSAMSTLLPIDLRTAHPQYEVIICGGNTRDSYIYSTLLQPNRTFFPALKDCGRLNLMKEGAQWDVEDMPSRRVMGDMLILPTGDLLLLNGAMAGTSSFNSAKDPNLTPVLYSPNKPRGSRFQELAQTTIPRMYHSTAALLPSGEILVGGSNTNPYYMLPKYNDNFTFPTELRLEKFSPPYLDPKLQQWRVKIKNGEPIQMKYGKTFVLNVIAGSGNLYSPEVKVTMYSPPFTTHGYSQNQRLLILKSKKVKGKVIVVEAPPSGKVAPPGYYLLFVVRRGVPSRGVWARIDV